MCMCCKTAAQDRTDRSFVHSSIWVCIECVHPNIEIHEMQSQSAYAHNDIIKKKNWKKQTNTYSILIHRYYIEKSFHSLLYVCRRFSVLVSVLREMTHWIIAKKKENKIIDRTRSTIRSMGISPLDISISKKQLSVTQFQSLILKLSFECPLNACLK